MDDINKHFRAGFALNWDGCLNHWMVDYNIICILKGYVGYSSWTNVPTKQRELCYRNYNQNVTLSEWDIEQERYWTCHDKIFGFGISCVFQWTTYRNIPSWNILSDCFRSGILIKLNSKSSDSSKYSNLEYVVVLCLLSKLYVVVYYPLITKCLDKRRQGLKIEYDWLLDLEIFKQ